VGSFEVVLKDKFEEDQMERILTGRDLPGGRAYDEEDDDYEGNQPFIVEDEQGNEPKNKKLTKEKELQSGSQNTCGVATEERDDEALSNGGGVSPPSSSSSSSPSWRVRLLILIAVLVSFQVMVGLVLHTGMFTAMGVEFRDGILVSPYPAKVTSLLVDPRYYEPQVTKLTAPLTVPLMTSQMLPTINSNKDKLSTEKLVTSCKTKDNKDSGFYCPSGYRCSLQDSRCVVDKFVVSQSWLERCETLLSDQTKVYHHLGSQDYSRSKQVYGATFLTGSAYSVFFLVSFYFFAATSFAAVVVLLRDIQQYKSDDPEQAFAGRCFSFIRGARKQLARYQCDINKQTTTYNVFD